MTEDPYKYFRIEARDLLTQLGQGALDLERGPAPGSVSRLLRLAHTLKGAARVVGQAAIAEYAHAIEEALAPWRESSTSVPRESVDRLLAHVDAIGAGVSALQPAPEPAAAGPQPPVEDPVRGPHAGMAELGPLLDGLAEARVQLGAVHAGLASTERAARVADALAEQLSPLREGAGTSTAQAHLMAEEVSDLVRGIARRAGASLTQVERELEQVQEIGERLRLVPAGAIFTTLERAARDAAHALGKRVVWEARGADVRLDANVLASVQSALVQVIRNAVAHGIEAPADRQRVGKSAEGHVTLDVVRRGRRVEFTCRDDGRGIDLDAVRRVLGRKGLPASDATGLGTEELLRRLLEGGISTSVGVTEVAGRGIGLDVLRETAKGLGGETDVRTVAGAGTTVVLRVPLSIAALDAMHVEASGTVVSLPLDAVRRTLRIARADVTRTPEGEHIVHEGKVLPFAPLARALGIERTGEHAADAWSAVVVAGVSGSAALGVDRLLGTGVVVMRPLPRLAPASEVVAGASIDPRGRPRLVLEPDALVAEAERAVAAPITLPRERLPVLVIDDSLTTRMLEQSILESAGYAVDLAPSGEEALAKAHRRRYALFLVDVEMPGMDGFTFIERAREDPMLRDVPAILVTSRAAPEDRRRGEEVGARAYIVKAEFDQGKLLERIRALVQ